MVSVLLRTSQFPLEEDVFRGRYGVRQIMVILRSLEWAYANGESILPTERLEVF